MGKALGWGRSLKWANWVLVNIFVSRWLDSGFEGPSWVDSWVERASASCVESDICFDEVGVPVCARPPRNLGGNILDGRHNGMFHPHCDFAGDLDIVDGDDIRVGDRGPRRVPRSDG